MYNTKTQVPRLKLVLFDTTKGMALIAATPRFVLVFKTTPRHNITRPRK